MSGAPPSILPIVQDVFPEISDYVLQEYFPEPQQPIASTSFMTGDEIVFSWMILDEIIL